MPRVPIFILALVMLDAIVGRRILVGVLSHGGERRSPPWRVARRGAATRSVTLRRGHPTSGRGAVKSAYTRRTEKSCWGETHTVGAVVWSGPIRGSGSRGLDVERRCRRAPIATRRRRDSRRGRVAAVRGLVAVRSTPTETRISAES